jgi:L-ascorbate metabolism protein UlaG (beta-lactamase superfamily)
MKLIWHGHSCFELDFEGVAVIADPFDAHVGYPVPSARADIVTNSHGHGDHNYNDELTGEFELLNREGEYSFPAVTIKAIPSFHDDANGAQRGANLIFTYEAEGLKFAHLGDLGHFPDADQLRALAGTDVLLIPIGGYYTIDTPTALKIIEAIQPKLSVAMHFNTAVMKFPISDETQFVAETGARRVNSQAIEITAENINGLAGAIVMDYPKA